MLFPPFVLFVLCVCCLTQNLTLWEHMPMTNLRSYHWHHRFYWTFFNLACCEVWFQLTRHNESITCWSPVWMNLHTASFLPCCPATIATSPVVNLPVRRWKHQPGTLPWASLHCRCAEKIRGLDLTPGSVSDLSFYLSVKKTDHYFKTPNPSRATADSISETLSEAGTC